MGGVEGRGGGTPAARSNESIDQNCYLSCRHFSIITSDWNHENGHWRELNQDEFRLIDDCP